MKFLLILLVLTLALFSCRSQELPEAQAAQIALANIGIIEGQLTYLTREAMITPYVVFIELYRINADGTELLVASTDFLEEGQVPVHFMLAYNRSLVDSQNNSYLINARFVSLDGSTSHEARERLDPFSGQPLRLLMDRVR